MGSGARLLLGLVALGLASGCASRRLIRLENEVLRAENAELLARNHALEKQVPDPESWAAEADLDVIAEWLDRAGYVFERQQEGRLIRLRIEGENTTFSISIQHFESARVLFLATNDYLRLAEAPDSRGVVLLLVKLAALNYELVIGKYQLEPESGDILLSAELHLGDGLGYDTFVRVLDRIIRVADERYPELSKATGGRGL